jgi:hypothetical protein
MRGRGARYADRSHSAALVSQEWWALGCVVACLGQPGYVAHGLGLWPGGMGSCPRTLEALRSTR